MFFLYLTLVISVLLCWITFKKSPKGYYSAVLLSATSTIQVITSQLLVIFDKKALINNTKYLIYFQKIYDEYVYTCLFFQLIIFLALLFTVRVFRVRDKLSIREFFSAIPVFIPRFYAFLGLIFIVLYPINEFLPQVLAYFLRLSLGVFVVSPVLAGYLFFKSGKAFNGAWLVVLVFFTAWSFTIGSRGHATLFLVYYFFGLFCGARSPQLRSRILLLSLIIIYPFTTILGAVGGVRDEIGRVSTADITENRIRLFLTEFSKDNDATKKDQSFVHGIYRLINWANPAVIYLTPERVGYRYFGSVPKELLAILDISIISGKSPREKRKEDIRNKLGTAAANDYGFKVTETNSVEFGVIADSWSRAGVWGLVIVVFIMISTFLWVETLIIGTRKNNIAFSIVTQFYFLSVVFSEFPSVPVTYFVRDNVLNFSFIFVLTAITSRLYKHKWAYQG
jgi:hypothetical protein